MRYVRAVIKGRVQGVGYRQATVLRARELNVQGYVCNREDGSVEVGVSGADECVARLLDWLESGPPAARVERVDCEELESRSWQGFEIRRSGG